MRNVICPIVFGLSLAAIGEDTSLAHIQDIRHAIRQFRGVASTNVSQVSHDFDAIFDEIREVKPESEKDKLIEELVVPFFDVQSNSWKRADRTAMLLTRNRMLRVSLGMLSGPRYAMFKWDCHLKRLQALKEELVQYADAKPTDDETQKKYLYKFLEDEVARRKAKAPNELVVFSMSVPTPKEWDDASTRVGYKRRLEAEVADYIKERIDSINAMITFKELLPQEQQSLMARVREEIGRYPKWYKDEGETEKRAPDRNVKSENKSDIKVDVDL